MFEMKQVKFLGVELPSPQFAPSRFQSVSAGRNGFWTFLPRHKVSFSLNHHNVFTHFSTLILKMNHQNPFSSKPDSAILYYGPADLRELGNVDLAGVHLHFNGPFDLRDLTAVDLRNTTIIINDYMAETTCTKCGHRNDGRVQNEPGKSTTLAKKLLTNSRRPCRPSTLSQYPMVVRRAD